jgi:hypothetical protein
VPPIPAPPRPDVHPDELRLGSPYALTEGIWFTIGWQRWPDDEGGPGFALLRRSRMGTLRVVQRYPFTGEGWSLAWDALAFRDRVTADVARNVLVQRAAARPRPAPVAGGVPGRPGGGPAAGLARTAGGQVLVQAGRAGAQAGHRISRHSRRLGAPATNLRARADAWWRRAALTPVNVIIAASLLCGVLGTVSGAAGALPLTLALWSLAGAPYAVVLLAFLCYLPVAGVRALARRRSAPPPAPQAGGPS